MFQKPFLEEIESHLKKIKGNFKESYLETDDHFCFYYNKEWKGFEHHLTGMGLRIERNHSTIFKKKQSKDLNKIVHFVKYFDEKESLKNKDLIEKKFAPVSKNLVYSNDELDEHFGEMESLIQKKEEFKSFSPFITITRKNVAVINNEGVLTNEERNFSSLYIKVEEKSSSPAAESRILWGNTDFSEIKRLFKEALEESCRLSRFRKSASNKISGEMPVVFSSRASGFLLNETISHFFESDLEKKTNFSHFLGEKIAPETITIFDNGPLNGFAQNDDEGFEPLRGVVMIEKGRVANLLTNRKSAKALSLKRTGNGRRCNFRCQPIVGVWNISLMPSKYDEMELIENVDFGLYVKRLEDGYLSIRKGKFSFPVTEAYIIRNGKIGESVKDIEIKGETPRFLNEIEMIGSKAETFGGLRKKGEQYYTTFETCPPILVKKLSVATKN